MPRPTSIRDEDILRAAREVFLERGIRATSAEVAARACVSEGSIFKRFPSKERLFHAALRVDMDAALGFTDAMKERVGKKTVRANLEALGGELLVMFRLVLPVMMMRWSNPDDHLEEMKLDGSPPMRLLRAVKGYLAAEAKLGRLESSDVEALARAYLGAIQNYAFFEILLRARHEAPTPAATFVARLVEGLWKGCAPRAEVPKRAPRRLVRGAKIEERRRRS